MRLSFSLRDNVLVVMAHIKEPVLASTTSIAVFSISELLENILWHLPLQKILIFQRVCRHWKHIITTSSSFQELLFFRVKAGSQDGPKLNPLLRLLFPPLFDISAFVREKNDATLGYYAKGHSVKEIYQLPWYKDIVRRKSVLREDASWRKMFPVQPPAKIDELMIEWCCGCARSTESRVIANKYQHEQEAGAKMGLVFDVLVAMMDASGYRGGDGFFIMWGMFPPPPVRTDGPYNYYRSFLSMKSVMDYWNGNTHAGNYITIYENHSVECYGNPFAWEGGTSCTGLRIKDYPVRRCSRARVTSQLWDKLQPSHPTAEPGEFFDLDDSFMSFREPVVSV